MSMENHIKRLVLEHRILDEQIEAMESSGHFDDEELTTKKKKRLHLKDEITRLRKSENNN